MPAQTEIRVSVSLARSHAQQKLRNGPFGLRRLWWPCAIAYGGHFTNHSSPRGNQRHVARRQEQQVKMRCNHPARVAHHTSPVDAHLHFS